VVMRERTIRAVSSRSVESARRASVRAAALRSTDEQDADATRQAAFAVTRTGDRSSTRTSLLAIVRSTAAARSAAFAASLALVAACASSRSKPDLSPLRPDEDGYAVLCAKVLTVDDADHIYSPGMILVRGKHIAYVGERRTVPAGYRTIDCGDAWATPGEVELHSHIHAGGFGDINDMVIPVNPELRASAGLRPSNADIKRACAGGVTTLFGIPGSGTSNSGFGVVYKAKTHAKFEESVVRDPGGMKIAQSYNPERRAGDLGATRAGLSWILQNINERALGAIREDRFDPALENLKKVHEKELPVLIHSAGSDGYAAAARMWKEKYDTNCVLSHGCFTAHEIADYIVGTGAPINAGPRTMDYVRTHDGAITGTVEKYLAAGAKNLSVCTDSPVMPQEELFLQGAESARLGADSYQMLRACTIHPAKVFGLADRLGSLEVGKDADIVIHAGDPLDPRARVDLVLIDGGIEYDRKRDGQWF
jgi:imidazolonepropionase-like amidohydrolase